MGGSGAPAKKTTRPELIPSVVALIAHPDDERYQGVFGTTVTSPVFGVEIPVLAHPAAEPDKGAGIAMCCTFGDLTDVQWWRELQLPVRTVIGRDGRLFGETPEWLSTPQASEAYAAVAGKTVFSADLDPAVSANPYFEFDLKVPEAGTIAFEWIDDDGSVYTEEKPIAIG